MTHRDMMHPLARPGALPAFHLSRPLPDAAEPLKAQSPLDLDGDFIAKHANHLSHHSRRWIMPPPAQQRLLGGTLATLEILPGFFRSCPFSTDIRECFHKEACQGGDKPTDYCAIGYGGPCESCHSVLFSFSACYTTLVVDKYCSP